VLYLAEVHKKTSFMAGVKAELRLLARQQAEQSWSPVPGEEMVPFESATDFNHGHLVLVDLTANRQVQQVQDAAKQLVAILQNFTRMREKFLSQEEEIEGWKQSLVYQSQELTGRELEMQARQEELELLQSQTQEIADLKMLVDRESAELTSLKDKIAADQARLEKLRTEAAGGLNSEQLQQAHDLLNGLSAGVHNPQSLEDLQACSAQIQQQQEWLNQRWADLEQLRTQVQQQEHAWEQQTKDIALAWQSWHEAQAVLEESQAALKNQEHNLVGMQANAAALEQRLQNSQGLAQQLVKVLEGNASGQQSLADLQPLLEMPIEDLMTATTHLEQEVAKMTSFVNDQEEELTALRQDVEQLQHKIEQVSEFERLNLLSDLEAEQHSCRLADETLQGQRQRLRERQDALERHQTIFKRRQDPLYQVQMNLQPLLKETQTQTQQLQEEQDQLRTKITDLQAVIAQLRADVEQQQATQESQRHSLVEQESTTRQTRLGIMETWGQINTLEATLQPCQDSLNAIQHGLVDTGNQNLQNGQSQQLLSELKSLILGSAGA
jgi:chromosome segregation ATPase